MRLFPVTILIIVLNSWGQVSIPNYSLKRDLPSSQVLSKLSQAVDSIVVTSKNWMIYDSADFRIYGLPTEYVYFCNGFIALVDDSQFTTIYSYSNINNNLMGEYFYENHEIGNSLMSFNRYEYDDKNNLIRVSRNDSDSVMVDYRIYEYDAENNNVRTSYYSGSDSLESYSLYEFDNHGNMVRKSYLDADGQVISTNISRYDSLHKLIEHARYRLDTLESANGYEYDSLGNMFRRNNYDSDSLLTSYSIHYYHELSNEVSVQYYSPEDSLLQYFISQYDQYNNLVNNTGYTGDSVFISSTTNTYVYKALNEVCVEPDTGLGIFDKGEQNRISLSNGLKISIPGKCITGLVKERT